MEPFPDLATLDDAELKALIEHKRGQYREAAGRWPEDPDLAKRLGIALAALGQRDEALTVLAGVPDRGSNDPDALFVALRLLFGAHAARTAGPQDLERLARYARAYVAVNGPQKELVALWERHLRAP